MLYRRYYRFSDLIRQHFFEFRWLYLSLALMCALGIGCGFYRGVTIKTTLTIDSIRISHIANLVRGNSKASAFFASHLLINFVVVVCIFAANLHIYVLPLNFVIMFYRGYLLGLNFYILTVLSGFGASMLLWVIVFPLEILILLSICGAGVICSHRCIYFYRFGSRECGNFVWLIKSIWVFIAMLVVFCFLEFLALQFFNSSFILII